MKKISLYTLPLILAACSGTGTPGASVVTVSADKLTADLGSAATATTAFTFTNKAGSRSVTLDSATLSWTDPTTNTLKTAQVTLPAITLPAGLTCAAVATDATASCNFNDAGTTYADRSLVKSISDSQLFSKVLSSSPSATNLPVSVTFNSTSNPLAFTFTSAVTTGGGGGGAVTKAPAPVLSVNTTGVEPYSGNLSVSIAGNFDATSTVDRVILEITDSKGQVDNSTFVSTNANASFTIDTSKYIDGIISLKAIALTKDGLRGESAVKAVQIRNVSAPAMSIVSPDSGATVTGPTTVRVQFRQGNSAFTLAKLDSSGNDVQLNVIDFRGQVAKTVYGKSQKVSEGVFEAFIPLDLIGPDFSSNAYTLVASASATLSDGSTRTLGSTTQISTVVNDNKPPAMTIVMPAYFQDPYLNPGTRATLSRNSAFMVYASDDNGISSIRLDFVCDNATKLSTQVCPASPYEYNLAVNSTGPLYRVFNVGALVDGQPYVQDGNYTLRVTAFDGSKANIQEFPVKLTRAVGQGSIAGLSDGQAPVVVVPSTVSGEPNPSSATWSIAGTTANPVRVATLAYDNTLAIEIPSRQRIDSIIPAGSTIALSQGFSAAGQYRIDFIVEDLVTGVVRYYEGQVVVVKINK